MKQWEIPYLVGRKQMELLARGLLYCNGKLLDSYKLPNYTRDAFHVLVSLPDDKVEMFKIVTQLELHEPLKVQA